MLDLVFRSRRVLERLRVGVLGSALEILTGRLQGAGYSAQVIQKYSRAIGHFAHWMESEGIAPSAVGEETVDTFLTGHLLRCRCPVACREGLPQVRAALGHLLDVLGVEREHGAQGRLRSSAQDGLLGPFATYLCDARGLASTTRNDYLRRAAAFLKAISPESPIDPARLKPRDVLDYVSERAARLKPGSLKQEAIALRSFLRCLQLRGLSGPHLVEAVPTIPQWRLDRLPRVMTDEQVRRLLGSFDGSTPDGLRGYAMALCLVRLGLRSAEVAQLSLDDVDWREGTLRIVEGKGRRDRALPLPPDVGRAIVAYLRGGRPSTSERWIFVRHRFHRGRRISSGMVRDTIRHALECAGVARPHGAHTLRHTAATRLLRSGASLKQIADILGHRSIDTTCLYAKVDLDQLLQVALPWPVVRP